MREKQKRLHTVGGRKKKKREQAQSTPATSLLPKSSRTSSEQSLALFFCYYNFCHIHQTLRVTPAMAAGVSTKVWELSDIVALLDSEIAKAA